MLGRIDWNGIFLDKHIRSDLSYTIGNSRELKRNYIFFQVPTGEGTHTWRDDNRDGEQDIGEFYPAINPDERNYIKLFTPSDEYILAYENSMNYNLRMDMPRSWKHEGGIKNVLARVSNTLTLHLQQKVNQENFHEYLFFNGTGRSSEDLISYNNIIRNTFQFNPSEPTYGIDLIYNKLNFKQLISNGFEAREKQMIKLLSRVNIQRDYNVKIYISKSSTINQSDFLEGRNYLIGSREINAILEWQPSNFWRMTSEYTYGLNLDNTPAEMAQFYSRISEGGLGFRFSKAASRSIESNFRYVYIDFSGVENSAVGYELLQGLKPGNNLTWRVNWQQKLLNGLQFNISYEGRKSGDLDIIHIGRMQVMALF